jgi:cysteinyl-tRNA synthetase
MSMRYLGASFDLHTGGIDLVFPHHEDEIAQSEAATGQPFVGTWMHCAHLHMRGEKMAKRSGNFARPADVYAAGISPRALRFALLATHYRSPLEFSDASLAHASAAVERFDTAVTALEAYAEERPDDAAMAQLLADARAGFAAGLEDDLNISAALAALFELVRELNSRVAARSLSNADARRAASQLRELDSVLGVLDDGTPELPPELATLLDARAAARAQRDWARSDTLRDELGAAGVSVEDTPDGQRWRRTSGP